MLTKLKSILAGALLFTVAALATIVKILSKKNDDLKGENASLNQINENMTDDIKTAQQANEVLRNANKIDNDVNALSDNDVNDRLHQFDRNKNDTGSGV